MNKLKSTSPRLVSRQETYPFGSSPLCAVPPCTTAKATEASSHERTKISMHPQYKIYTGYSELSTHSSVLWTCWTSVFCQEYLYPTQAQTHKPLRLFLPSSAMPMIFWQRTRSFQRAELANNISCSDSTGDSSWHLARRISHFRPVGPEPPRFLHDLETIIQSYQVSYNLVTQNHCNSKL